MAKNIPLDTKYIMIFRKKRNKSLYKTFLKFNCKDKKKLKLRRFI